MVIYSLKAGNRYKSFVYVIIYYIRAHLPQYRIVHHYYNIRRSSVITYYYLFARAQWNINSINHLIDDFLKWNKKKKKN